MDLVLGLKARSISALGNAQGQLDKIIFYHPSRLRSRTIRPGAETRGNQVGILLGSSDRPRPLAWAGMGRTVGA